MNIQMNQQRLLFLSVLLLLTIFVNGQRNSRQIYCLDAYQSFTPTHDVIPDEINGEKLSVIVLSKEQCRPCKRLLDSLKYSDRLNRYDCFLDIYCVKTDKSTRKRWNEAWDFDNGFPRIILYHKDIEPVKLYGSYQGGDITQKTINRILEILNDKKTADLFCELESVPSKSALDTVLLKLVKQDRFSQDFDTLKTQIAYGKLRNEELKDSVNKILNKIGVLDLIMSQLVDIESISVVVKDSVNEILNRFKSFEIEVDSTSLSASINKKKGLNFILSMHNYRIENSNVGHCYNLSLNSKFPILDTKKQESDRASKKDRSSGFGRKKINNEFPSFSFGIDIGIDFYQTFYNGFYLAEDIHGLDKGSSALNTTFIHTNYKLLNPLEYTYKLSGAGANVGLYCSHIKENGRECGLSISYTYRAFNHININPLLSEIVIESIAPAITTEHRDEMASLYFSSPGELESDFRKMGFFSFVTLSVHYIMPCNLGVKCAFGMSPQVSRINLYDSYKPQVYYWELGLIYSF